MLEFEWLRNNVQSDQRMLVSNNYINFHTSTEGALGASGVCLGASCFFSGTGLGVSTFCSLEAGLCSWDFLWNSSASFNIFANRA